MNNAWEVIAASDGTFSILREGQVLGSPIPDRYLEEELAKYGLCGTEYQDMRSQLEKTGRARITLEY